MKVKYITKGGEELFGAFGESHDVRTRRKFIKRCCPFCGEEVNYVEL